MLDDKQQYAITSREKFVALVLHMASPSHFAGLGLDGPALIMVIGRNSSFYL